MYINTNVSALNAQRQLYMNELGLDKSLERLSSGLRINTGADDASGLAIAEKMRAQNVGLTTAIQNTQDGSSFFKIADGSMDQVSRILSRAEELLVRANNRTLTDNDRLTIQEELTQLIDQIKVTAQNTEYNTLKFLDGSIDIKKSLSIDTTIVPAVVNGSLKILETPGTVKSASAVVLSITALATPAVLDATPAPAPAGTVGTQSTINVNGVDVQIASSDTVSTLLSKINAANSKTKVIAVMSGAVPPSVGLVSGIIDDDAKNIVDGVGGAAAKNGSAIGYSLVGSQQTILLGGDSNIWGWLGFGPPIPAAVAGTNVAGNLGGISMQGSGSVLAMEDSGSQLYGMKIGTNMYNDAYGGYVITGPGTGAATIASCTVDTSQVTDGAFITTDDSKKTALQLGANYNQSIAYTIKSIMPDSLGVGASSKISSLSQISVISVEDANLSLKVLQKSITDITSIRAEIGATLNRLEYTEKTLRIQRENMASAESKIRDADMAQEMTTYTRNQILAQTGTAMLAQANSRPQSVLQLLKS